MIRRTFARLVRSAFVVGVVGFSAMAYAAIPLADQTFVTTAARAGMAEVELGSLAAQDGNTAAVKRFGTQMVKDHTKANAELTAQAKAIGATLPTVPDPRQQDTIEKLKSLHGAAFDQAYTEAMVKDHEDAVALFDKEASSSGNDALKVFAQKALPTLKGHLQMARELEKNAR